MTPAELHVWARPRILEALNAQGLEDEPISVAQAIQAVGWLESRYATAWKGAGVGSRNWGCIQAGRPPCNVTTSFVYTDSSPNADGTSTPYTICFKKYETDPLGAADLVYVGLKRRPRVLEAARRGDFYGVSAELHASRYYEGFGPTVKSRIDNHYRALHGSLVAAGKALAEPVGELFIPNKPAEPWHDDVLADNPLILRGSRGPYVKVWQGILGDIALDGLFGPITQAETRKWQIANRLVPDGKVGPKTWAKAALIGV